MKVLLVDDHPLILSALQTVIQGLGDDVTVVGAASGREARQILRDGSDYDLILLDLQLGDVDGFELLVELRANYPAVPVVIVSASDRASDVIRAVDLGAIHPQTLIQRLSVTPVLEPLAEMTWAVASILEFPEGREPLTSELLAALDDELRCPEARDRLLHAATLGSDLEAHMAAPSDNTASLLRVDAVRAACATLGSGAPLFVGRT
ncbi:MAG TPA: response regulator, partial [Burkholderiaceae bacterium]|nr:response regulator [Burkholderiaceae bacterium]